MTFWSLTAALLLAFAVGFGCRWLNVPVPAPPSLLGVVLIGCITVGYLAADRLSSRSAAPTEQGEP